MVILTKAEQWKRAAIVIRWLELSGTAGDEAALRKSAETALEIIQPTMPWEYPWSEVVRSQRDRRR